MTNMDIVQDINERIEKYSGERAAELAEIQRRKSAAQDKLAELKDNMKKAAEALDEQAYSEAMKEAQKLSVSLEMYETREKQFSHQEIISEAESDEVIDLLLNHQKKIEEDFINELKEPLKQLEALRNNYLHQLRATAKTINEWCAKVHANYSTRGATWRTDPATGEKTDRSETPVPVITSKECKESGTLGLYLENADKLINYSLG